MRSRPPWLSLDWQLHSSSYLTPVLISRVASCFPLGGRALTVHGMFISCSASFPILISESMQNIHVVMYINKLFHF